MRMALTSEARQRLANIKMVKPQIAQTIEDYIVQMATSGKLKQVIDDDQLKEMLGSIQGKKREFTIKEDLSYGQRKRQVEEEPPHEGTGSRPRLCRPGS